MRDLVLIFLVVILLRSLVITPFRINGSSMETSYHDKEYIIVDKFSFLNFKATYGEAVSEGSIEKITQSILSNLPIHIGDPERGDVVVITPHVDRKKEYYIKRVIGLPGDTIQFEDGEVFVKKAGTETFVKLNELYLSKINK
jgi:signal peptidase I